MSDPEAPNVKEETLRRKSEILVGGQHAMQMNEPSETTDEFMDTIPNMDTGILRKVGVFACSWILVAVLAILIVFQAFDNNTTTETVVVNGSAASTTATSTHSSSASTATRPEDVSLLDREQIARDFQRSLEDMVLPSTFEMFKQVHGLYSSARPELAFVDTRRSMLPTGTIIELADLEVFNSLHENTKCRVNDVEHTCPDSITFRSSDKRSVARQLKEQPGQWISILQLDAEGLGEYYAPLTEYVFGRLDEKYYQDPEQQVGVRLVSPEKHRNVGSTACTSFVPFFLDIQFDSSFCEMYGDDEEKALQGVRDVLDQATIIFDQSNGHCIELTANEINGYCGSADLYDSLDECDTDAFLESIPVSTTGNPHILFTGSAVSPSMGSCGTGVGSICHESPAMMIHMDRDFPWRVAQFVQGFGQLLGAKNTHESVFSPENLDHIHTNLRCFDKK